jgi:hypothetical protein
MADGRQDNDEARRGIIPGRLVKVVGEARVPGPHEHEEEAAAEPRVELIRDGDVIQAIDVTCTCGKRIRLRCIY